MRIDWRAITAVSAAALLLNACDAGGGSNSTLGDAASADNDASISSLDGTSTGGQGDATVQTDATPVGVDDTGPGPVEDGGTAPVDPPISADCDKSGFSAANEIAVIDQGQGGTYMIYQAHSAAQPPLDLISVEINAASAPSAGSTVDLTGAASMNLAGANLVVALATGCSQQGCGAWLLADEGSITFTELSDKGNIVATLTNVVFREVNVDQSTGDASVKPNGSSWCVSNWEINKAFEQPPELPTGGPAQATCVAEGTGVYKNDNVANLQLVNCNGDTVSLHDTCGQSKAHWLLGTAGWCSACSEMLAGLNQQFGENGVLSRASIAAAQPGLDLWVILGENQQGGAPSQQFCKSYAQSNGLDPAMVLIDFVSPEVDIPLVDPPGYSVPVSGLGNTWQAVNPYLVADGQGVTLGYPWNATLRGTNMEYHWSDYMGGDLNQALGELLQ